MKSLIISISVLFFTFWLTHSCAGQSLRVIELTDGMKEVYLYGDHLEIAEDTSGSWQIEDVTDTAFAGFVVNTEDYRYTENHESTYWVHLKLLNNSLRQRKWVFEVLAMHTQDLQFYFPEKPGTYVMRQTGEGFDFRQREYLVKNFVFDLPLDERKYYDVYIRVKSYNDAGFEYKIRNQQYFTFYATHEYLFLGIYYGILIFIILYNLILFVTSLDKIYLFYIFYLLGCCLVSFAEDGLCFEFFWPRYPELNIWVGNYCEQFFIIGFISYASYFTALPQSYPKMFRILLVLIGTYLFVESVFTSYTEFMFLYVYWMPFVLIYLVAIYSYYKGNKTVRFFIIGYSFVLISVLMTRLRWYGLIEANIFTVYSFYFGVILEAFVFSFAIADRFNLIKKEKETAQQNLISQLEENKALQNRVNAELEQKVKERTLQLQDEKEKLDTANKKLEELTAELNSVNSKLDFENWHLQKNLKEETRSRILFEKVSYEEFIKIFPQDFTCLKYLEEVKWQGKYVCHKCGNNRYSELKDEHLSRRCTRCGYIESATAHTIFQSVKFPLNKAFYIVYFCSLESEKMTVDELSERLQLRRNTCWSFRKKVQERIVSVKERLKLSSIKNWESLILDEGRL